MRRYFFRIFTSVFKGGRQGNQCLQSAQMGHFVTETAGMDQCPWLSGAMEE